MNKLRFLLKFTLLLCFWLLLSGSVDWQHILVGVAVAALIVLFWRNPAEKARSLRFKPILYGAWLGAIMLAEIWKSAWHVARIILSGQKVDPEFVWVDTPIQSPLGRVIFANCITLTPGTLTVSLEGSRLLVHALTPEFAQGLKNWRVHNILQKMEGKA